MMHVFIKQNGKGWNWQIKFDNAPDINGWEEKLEDCFTRCDSFGICKLTVTINKNHILITGEK